MQFHISLLKIPAQDIDSAVAFYQNALGWTLEFAVAEYGWAQLQAGDLPIALYKPGMGGGNRQPGGSLDFHLAVADLDALEARIRAKGPEVEVGIFTNDDGSRTLEFRDPDGNEWKIGEIVIEGHK